MKKELKAVKKLINKPQKWMKNDYENNRGRFCLIGAVRSCFPFQYSVQIDIETMLNKIAVMFGDYSAINFNDAKKTKHKDVMKLLNRAIKEAVA